MLPRPPDQDQREYAIDPRRSVLVRAPAGSGKTGVLLLRYLNCLLTVAAPEQVVAITFTNKAAGEIRERVISALRRGASEASEQVPDNAFDADVQRIVAEVLARDRELQWRLLENSGRLRIQTFDSFCASLTRRLPLLSGLGAARPLNDPNVVYREAILALFRQIDEPGCDAELKGALLRLLAYGSNRIESLIPLLSALLAKRDQWQRDILSGDIDEMEAALREEVAEVFEQSWQTLRELGVNALVEAFIESSGVVEDHAWAADLRDAGQLGIEQFHLVQMLADTILNNDGGLYGTRSLHYAGFKKGQPGTDGVRQWLDELTQAGASERASACLQLLRTLPPAQLPESSRQQVADFRIALLHLLAYLRLAFEQHGGVDFGEIAQRAIYALRQDDDDVGDALLEEERIQHILVDEMQDTSVSQIDLLSQLCQHWQEGDGRSVFFCGDLQQSIYAFRGSLVSLFDELIQRQRFAGRPIQLLQLQANFRSSPDLVNWVNQGFKTLFTDRGRYYAPAIPQRVNPGDVQVHAMLQAEGVKAGDQAAQREAELIVEIIQRVQAEDDRKGRVSSIGILVRNRSHLARILPALKQADIAFSGQDIDSLANTAAILDFTALLRALWHEADNVAWTRLLRAGFVGLSWEDIRLLRRPGGLLRDVVMGSLEAIPLSAAGRDAVQRLAAIIAQLEQHPESRDLRWALRSAWYELGGPACVGAAESVDVERVLALLDEFAPAGILQDIGGFERAVAALFATPPSASVELMTVHKSKGLEFDVVLLPGLGRRGRNSESPLLVWRRMQGHMVFAPKPGEAAVPDRSTADAAAEQRLYRYLDGAHREELEAELDRQIYVALTRARRELHLFGLAAVDKKGDVTAEKSSCLAHLWPVLAPAFEGGAGIQPAHVFDVADPEQAMRVPLAPGLAALKISLGDFYQPRSTPVSALQQAQRFTENALLEDNIEQRAMGIVFHELMEHIGRTGDLDRWLEMSPTRRAGLQTTVQQRLRHHCHPEPGLNDNADQVIALLDNTLSCETGRWILGSYQWQGSEQTLRRLMEGRWQTLILDRVFIERRPDNTERCWIVDYKTAHAQGAVDRFLADQADRYRQKMNLYREALRETGVECPVFAALYFPAHKQFLVLE